MTRRKSATANLTSVEIEDAARRMLLGAQAHQRASAYCHDNPAAKPPSMDALFFSTVAFELILNSIEQSLRLLLLLEHSIRKPTHNVSALYKTIIGKSSSRDGIRGEIVRRVTELGKSIGMEALTEDEIRACLKKHDSSYSSFRYFGLDDGGRLTLRWEMKPYEVKLVNCLALALIQINCEVMRKRGIRVAASMQRVTVSDMTVDQQALMARMKEQSTR